MKKCCYLMAVVPFLLVSSCEKFDDNQALKVVVSSLTVGIEQPVSTKTALIQTHEILWDTGDQFLIQDATWNWRTFTLVSGAGTTSASFSTPGSVTLSVGNPMFYQCSNPTWNDPESRWYVDLSSNYEMADGGSGDNCKVPMIGYNTADVAGRKFQMLTGALKLDVCGIPADAVKMVITANRKITGTFPITNVRIGKYDYPEVATSGTSASENVITYSFDKGIALRSFVIPLPVCSEGYALDFELKDDTETSLGSKHATLPAITPRHIMYSRAIAFGSAVAETILWKGSVDLGTAWSVAVSTLSSSAFWTYSGIAAGSTLTIKFSQAGSGAHQIICKNGSWTAIDGLSYYIAEDNSDTSCSWVLTDAQADDIKTNGFIVSGYQLEIKEISIH